MSIRYDKTSDTLHINLGKAVGDSYELETGNFMAIVDDEDGLVEIIIKEASEFLKQATAVKLVGGKTTKAAKPSKPVWEDVDSSMISAFKYDEAEQTLEVAFNSTGSYRYFDVPPDVVKGLREASSKGSYMRWAIIDMYSYEKGGKSRR